jgi:putative phosphoribosyl transferase
LKPGRETPSTETPSRETTVAIPVAGGVIRGDLALPPAPAGVVLFAHGSGSSRHSPRNRLVAGRLQQEALATVLLDLLTEKEEVLDRRDARLRFDIGLLASRLVAAYRWLAGLEGLAGLPMGFFGASTGAAAALVAAAEPTSAVRAVVSRGGRPDLAGEALAKVRAPTLLIVGGRDELVLDLNRQALAELSGMARLEVVPGATHLFEEAGALERVAELAAGWFSEHVPTKR